MSLLFILVSNGFAWWDTEQLLRQVKDAIQIFEVACYEVDALFFSPFPSPFPFPFLLHLHLQGPFATPSST